MSITEKFSSRAARMEPAAIRAVLGRMTPDCISFAAGKPAQHLFPIDAVVQQTGQLFEQHAGDALQYSATKGFLPLREWTAARVNSTTTADDICIVSGSQQAIDLVSKLFIDPGDRVIIEAPTYTSAISTFQVYGPELIAADSDSDGIVPESVEAALQQGAKLIYVIPNFANPSGVCMTLERRKALVALARQYNVPILEDDPYGELRFAGEPLPHLIDLAPEMVIYCSSFSKIIAPGMRVSWLTAPAEVLAKLIMAKQVTDLQTGTYQQILLHRVIDGMDFPAHLDEIRGYYGRQCELMLEVMDQHFPKSVHYDRPVGGMFIWCQLPEGLSAMELLDEALARKVAYIPGEAFFSNGRGQNTFRLSFSLASEEEIREGIAILGKLLHETIK